MTQKTKKILITLFYSYLSVMPMLVIISFLSGSECSSEAVISLLILKWMPYYSINLHFIFFWLSMAIFILAILLSFFGVKFVKENRYKILKHSIIICIISFLSTATISLYSSYSCSVIF